MPEILMNSLKSLAMNCGPLSEMIRGRASGYFSFAPYLCSILDGFNRYIVNWDIRESMTEVDIEILLQ
jgi:transposase InsO family protein